MSSETLRPKEVSGPRPYALQRLDWTGITPFEIKEINARPKGFRVSFTKPADRDVAADINTYALSTYTHIYQQGYGSPEVDHTTPRVVNSLAAEDGMSVELRIDGLVQGHIHDFDLTPMKSSAGGKLVHTKAYYTFNEIPNP